MSKGVIIMNGFGTRNRRGGTVSVTVFISVSRRSVEQSSVRLLEIEFGFLNRRDFREKISKNCRVKLLARIRNGSPTIQKGRKEKGREKAKVSCTASAC